MCFMKKDIIIPALVYTINITLLDTDSGHGKESPFQDVEGKDALADHRDSVQHVVARRDT